GMRRFDAALVFLFLERLTRVRKKQKRRDSAAVQIGLGITFMSAVARVIDLVKDYQMEEVIVPALRGVTLDFEEGDFIALMGPSGSGKSTLLNLLGCLDRPTSGQYFLGDEDVSRMEDDQLSEIRSRYIGFIFQSYNLLAQYTVVENIEVPLLYQGCRLTEATRE